MLFALKAIVSYPTLLPYYHNESKPDIQDHFIEKLKNYNGSDFQIWKPFISAIPNFTKSYIPEMLKDTNEIPTWHLIMTIFNSRKSGSPPRSCVDIYCYYCNICFNSFGVGTNSCLFHIQEICQGILQVNQKHR